MAIKNFRDKLTEEINYGRLSKRTQRILPAGLHQKAQIKLAILGAATNLNDLVELRGNRLEALKGDRLGQHSIRINDRYRICFVWTGTDAVDVEIVDYHKG